MDEKFPIPNALLPPRYHDKGYCVTMGGEVYGQRGHRLKLVNSPSGLGHPLLFGRNLWEIMATMFCNKPSPEHDKAVMIDGKVRWVTQTTYNKAYKMWHPRRKNLPLSDEQISFIKEQTAGGVSAGDIASALGVSIFTVYRQRRAND